MKDGYEWIHYGLGVMNLQKQRFDQAAEIFSEILKHKPESPDACVQLGKINQQKNEIKEAEVLFKQALKYDIHHESANYMLGILCMENGRLEDAEMHLTKVMEVNPDHINAIINLGFVYGREGDFYKAEQIISNAYIKEEKITDGFAKLGWIKAENQNWNDARKLMELDLVKRRLSPPWKVNLAIVKASLQQWQEAIFLISDAYGEDAKLRDGYSRLGWHGYLIGKGEKFFKEQIDMDAEIGRLSTKMTLIQVLYLVATDSIQDVLEIVESIYIKDLKEMSWLTNVGWLCVRIGKADIGCELMERDIALERMEKDWLPSYAVALSLCGKMNQALRVISEFLTDMPENDSLVIGYRLYPDALLNATKMKELISRKIISKYLKYLRANLHPVVQGYLPP